MVQAHRLATERIRAAGSRSKERYDATRSDHTYLVADLVWMFTPKVPKGHSKKLKLRWRGPYRVIEIRSALTYVLQHAENPKDVQVTHISRLKPHRGGDNIDDVNTQLKYTYPLTEEESAAPPQEASEQKEIEAILGHRRRPNGGFEFKVRYRGFTTKHNEWVVESDMCADSLLQRYWQTVQLRCQEKRPKGKRATKRAHGS